MILGVSADDLETLKAFGDKENITFPLIDDSSKNIKSSYDGGRVTYVIDKEGVVRFIQEGVPVNENLLKQLHSLK